MRYSHSAIRNEKYYWKLQPLEPGTSMSRNVLSALAVIENEVSRPRSSLEGSVTAKTTLLTL